MRERDRLDIDRRTYEPEELLGSPRPAMNWTFTRRHLIPLAAAAIAAGQLRLSFSSEGVTNGGVARKSGQNVHSNCMGTRTCRLRVSDLLGTY